ncbi:MAG: pilin [Elusimicrobiota bacterium]|jgi:prepilin-type N-terminal cleavage/methylation domain-containing protein|nr:pilin [Elusimicrobiota bacterium]
MKNKTGFTLIELLAVVLIIGILAAIALPKYQNAIARAKVTEGLSLMKSIYTAQQIYKLNNGVYSQTFDALDIEFPPEMFGSYHIEGSRLIGKNVQIIIYDAANKYPTFTMVPYGDRRCQSGSSFSPANNSCWLFTMYLNEGGRLLCRNGTREPLVESKSCASLGY